MDLGEQLLFMKTISNGLADLWSDLQTIRCTFYLSSRAQQVSDLGQLTTLFSSLREKWQPAKTLSNDPFKIEFDSAILVLTELRHILSHNMQGQGIQPQKSTSSAQPTSAPEKKPPTERQDTTAHHKPQKIQVDSVSAPPSAPTLPPPTTPTTPLQSPLGPLPEMPSSPTSLSPAISTTLLQSILGPPPEMPSFPTLLQSILGPPPSMPSYTPSLPSTLGLPPEMPSSPTSPQSRLDPPPRLPSSNTPASEPEAQEIPPPQRLLVCQPQTSTPATTSHNTETDSRSANLAEESDLPLHTTEIQNQHDCSDITSLPTSLLPSKDTGTQHPHPEEEATSALKDCEQLQSTYSLCSSANDEDTLTTSINLLQSTDNICLSNNSASQTESRQPPPQELLALHHPRSLTDGSTVPADLISTGTQQQLLPTSRNNLLENLTAPLQPPHHSMSLTDGSTATTEPPTSATSVQHILGEDIVPQASSAECQTPQQPQSSQAISAECQTPQQIHLPQPTEAFQQDFRRKLSREDALSLLHSDHSKQHHAPSLLTEKMDTVYLTRLLLHPQPTYQSLLINNLMLINSVSINPATLHYWIDSSIYISWLHDRMFEHRRRRKQPDNQQ